MHCLPPAAVPVFHSQYRLDRAAVDGGEREDECALFREKGSLGGSLSHSVATFGLLGAAPFP